MKFNLKEFNSYLMITIGLFINAFAWAAFLIPAKIIGGGLSGVGTLLYYSSDIPVGYTVFILNSILILIAWRILGSGFGVKAVYAIFVLGFFLSLLQQIITEPIVTENFMSAVLGGGLAGLGVGLTFSYGGSTAGTDVIAMIINKYKNVSPGRLILMMDVFIIASSYLVFDSIEKVVYGFVSMMVTGYVIDMVLVGSSKSVQLFIFTNKHEEVAEKLTGDLNRGITVIHGMGWYKKEKKDILMFVIRKKELNEVFKRIKSIDRNAFMSIGNVAGVYGNGFDRIK